MLPDRMLLSAYLDGEVPERFRSAIEDAIRSNDTVRREYEELHRLRQRLHDASEPDLSHSAERSWVRLNQRMIGTGRTSPWTRALRVPVPAAAAALVVFVAAVAVLVWSLVRPAHGPTSAEEYLARGSDVDVTISVEGSQMESVLDWLATQNMLGEVNIQLPEEQQFRIVGEPVFVMPADYEGDATQ
jgi:anti-sigma factor RsiW